MPRACTLRRRFSVLPLTAALLGLSVACSTWATASVAAQPSAQAGSGATQTPPNAADAYRRAFEWWREAAGTHPDRDDSTPPLLTQEDLNRIGDGLRGPLTPEILETRRKLEPFLAMIREAGGVERCDWGIDRSQGFDMLLPHLASLRNAARALRLDAEIRLREGDVDGASASIAAISGFARHSVGDEVLVSSLVGGAILMLQDGLLEQAIGAGLSPERAEALAKSLEAFRAADGASDPMGLAAAIGAEGQMARAGIEKLIAEGRWGEITGAGDPPTAEELGPELDRMEEAYAAMAAAAREPDRAKAMAAVKDIEARAAAGEFGALATLLLPALSRSLETNFRIEDALTARLAALEEIRKGGEASFRLANAAYPYLRAAATAAALPQERRSAIEALRVAPASLDAATVVATRRTLDGVRERLRSAFAEAGRRDRCDFRVSGDLRPNLVPTYLPDLRAAVRALLADALSGPLVPISPPASPSEAAATEPSGLPDAIASGVAATAGPLTAEEAIAATLRLVGHLGGDASLGHSMAATSLLEDAVDAIRQAARSGRLDAAAAKRLEALAATVDRAGPLGFAKALAADRDALVRPLAGWRPAGPKAEAVGQALARRDATAIAALCLGVQLGNEAAFDRPAPAPGEVRDETSPRWIAPRWDERRLREPLSGVADLVAPASVVAVAAAMERLTSSPGIRADDPASEAEFAGEDAKRAIAAFAATPWPDDVPARIALANGLLSSLDDALRAASKGPARPVEGGQR